MSFEFLSDTLRERQQAGLLRQRNPIISNKDGIVEINGHHYLNFASNDYLGLSQHEQVLQAYVEGLAVYGSGSGSSPVMTGYSGEHEALEDDLCDALNKPAAMLFNSGFAANQAICHALFGGTSTGQSFSDSGSPAKLARGSIVCDKLMHASFIQGALETPSRLSRFLHNDMRHASKLIYNMPANSLVATEGIFSMDGDAGNVVGLQQAIEKNYNEHNSQHKPWLMIDDAHAFGVVGKHGFGSLGLESINANDVNIVMGTFGKALGTSGAFVVGSEVFIEYMVNMSKHYVYSTANSAAQARATRVSIALVAEGQQREVLQQNIELFLSLAQARGLPLLPSSSPIQALLIGQPKLALECSEKLAELGLWVPAIRTPTVPKNTDRLRIIINAMHTAKDIHALVDGISMVLAALPSLTGQDNKSL